MLKLTPCIEVQAARFKSEHLPGSKATFITSCLNQLPFAHVMIWELLYN